MDCIVVTFGMDSFRLVKSRVVHISLYSGSLCLQGIFTTTVRIEKLVLGYSSKQTYQIALKWSNTHKCIIS